MALRQIAIVRDRLIAANPSELAETGAIEIVTVSTTGGRVQNRLLAEIGGKGLFAKEIEEALLAGDVDLAVHSLKDLETWLPDGLAIACVLPRDDPRDACIGERASLACLPRGATIGTTSLRRQAQLLRHRPDLSIVPIRGNVNTRIRKRGRRNRRAGSGPLQSRTARPQRVCDGDPAPRDHAAGGRSRRARYWCRTADEIVRQLVSPLHDSVSAACIHAERAMLAALDGSCRTPIAGFAQAEGDPLMIEGLLLRPDGSGEIRGQHQGSLSEAETLGTVVGKELRDRARSGFGLD